MDIPSIINHNYYVVRAIKTNKTWICEAERFDDKENMLYYYYGTYELGSDEHKNNCYLSNSYYDILQSDNDEVRLATPEEIDILMDILEKNGIVTTLQEAKDKAKAPDLKGEDYSNKRFGYKIPDGYEFDTVDNSKIILKPIKPKYPITYEECCEVLGCKSYKGFHAYGSSLAKDYDAHYWHRRQFEALYKLCICRDAYWKIAGEQMGLGKPWEPDWTNSEEKRYCIVNIEGDISLPEKTLTKWILKVTNKILVFPIEEMRDAFYENFKNLIEECKELL